MQKDRRFTVIKACNPDQAKTKKAIAVPLNAHAVAIIRRQLGKHEERVFAYRGQPIARCNNKGWRAAIFYLFNT